MLTTITRTKPFEPTPVSKRSKCRVYPFYYYSCCNRKELDNLCGGDETAHQGLVAEVEQLEEITFKEFVQNNKKENLNLTSL